MEFRIETFDHICTGIFLLDSCSFQNQRISVDKENENLFDPLNNFLWPKRTNYTRNWQFLSCPILSPPKSQMSAIFYCRKSVKWFIFAYLYLCWLFIRYANYSICALGCTIFSKCSQIKPLASRTSHGHHFLWINLDIEKVI